jgi:hypothetical protein
MRSLASTPRDINDEVKKFCGELEKSSEPFFVTVKPYHSSRYGECFENVNRYVGDKGGEKLYGWSLWKTGDSLLHAEFHAIHKGENGEYLDVTPYVKASQRILFLPSIVEYEQMRVPSRYHPLKEDVRITDFISALEDLTQIEEICANQSAKVYLELPENLVHLNALQTGMKDIEEKIELFEQMILGGRGRNDICFCGSGKKLKKCCG